MAFAGLLIVRGVGRRHNRAQLSLEFTFIVMILLFLTILFIIATGDKLNEFKTEKDVFLLKDTAGTVRNEVLVAYAMDSGYVRTFSLPDTLEGRTYNLTINDGFVSASLDNQVIEYAVPPVNGTLQKGNNVIRKLNGVIWINSS